MSTTLGSYATLSNSVNTNMSNRLASNNGMVVNKPDIYYGDCNKLNN
jgi:hypothetical protein